MLKWDKERRDNYRDALLDMKIQFDAISRNINEAGCDINIVIKDFYALLNEISFDRFGRTYYATMDKRYTQSPWFNQGCKRYKIHFHLKHSLFKQHPSDENRNIKLSANSLYNEKYK